MEEEDGWTLGEKLLLVEAVLKCGNIGNSWPSVSRVLRQHVSAKRNSHLFGSRKCVATYEQLVSDYDAINMAPTVAAAVAGGSNASTPSSSPSSVNSGKKPSATKEVNQAVFLLNKLKEQRMEELRRAIKGYEREI
ncbi:Bromodomain-containing protein 8, partial [Balamuthia mandrillaris]